MGGELGHEQSPAGPAGGAPQPDQTKATALAVIVVDDDPVVARLHATAVERVAGLRVAGLAGSAQEARRLLQTEPVDLILLDLSLPDEHGLTVLESLAATTQPPRPDVFVISAASDELTRRRADACGARRYFTKPFPLTQLIAHLQQYRNMRS